ncbi:SCL-interrupting locus protein homolog [Lepisosteus oculatus]|uniref:SCL-interrupting locus protein homolog n=1 Tax=Lepisosteus oculatus TaxID=7918 RepID=UPI00372376A9
MSMPVNLRNAPLHFVEGAYSKIQQQRIPRPSENMLNPFSFPKTRTALWDPSLCGEVTSLHLSYYRNPRLLVVEKALRLAHRHARQSDGSFFCFLLGSMMVDDDEEGITLTLDRFDPGRQLQGSPGKVPTALLPGDFVVPCTISTQGPALPDTVVHSAEDFNIAFKMLQHWCSSREPLDPSKLLTMRAHLVCAENMDSLCFRLHWAAVTVANTLDATPIRPVPIIPTALARNLTSPMGLTQVQSTCKFGFLTMDQTRKLLLLLESDPKAYTLPLVGIWLSGVTNVQSPQVWVCCLRYLFSSSLHDRVMSEGGGFLVVLYTSTHRYPEFYQCHQYNGQKELNFQLLKSTEFVNLYKDVEPSEGRPLQFELSAESQNKEREFFKEVASQVSFPSSSTSSPKMKLSTSDHDSGVEDEDLSPRPSPSPHPVSQQLHRIHPSVPELSLVLDGNFTDAKKVMPEASTAKTPNSDLHHLVKGGALPPLQSVHPAAKLSSQGSNTSPAPVSRLVTPMILPSKGCKGRLSPAQNPSVAWKDSPPTRKSSKSSASSLSSASSSSSASTPKSGPSPNTSVHQPKARSPVSTMKGPSPVGRVGQPGPQRPPSPSCTLSYRGGTHSTNFPSQTPLRSASFPFSGPNTASTCSCHHPHGHITCCHSNAWQGMSSAAPGSPGTCCPSDVSPRDCGISSFPQGNGCQSCGHCGLICVTSSPTDHLSHGKCSPVRDASVPVLPSTQTASPCKGQCCLRQQSCVALLPSYPAEDSAVGLLPADAYKILLEQDRQLKLLQAQIQRLLEAQNSPSGSSTVPCRRTPPEQAETQLQFLATETQTAPGVQMRKSVSIAVSTGASLFWSPTAEQQEEQQSEWQAPDKAALSVSGERGSEAFPPNAVNNPSFSETAVQEEALESKIQGSPCGVGPLALFQNSVLTECASVSFQSQPAEGASKLLQESPPEDNCQLQDEQKFYKDLLGQVNSRLQTSICEEEEEQDKWGNLQQTPGISPERHPPQCSPLPQKNSKKNTSGTRQASDQDHILSATLRQLQQFGVTVDLDSVRGKVTKTNVERASTLACINAGAVIPRLSYMSFGNVGASDFGSSGADLSLEANAIALKYLSDSQLSQLSERRKATSRDPVTTSALLPPGPMERSMLGLSVMSPSNMSFATRKYMKRYGLIEADDSSEEEEDGKSVLLETQPMTGQLGFRSENLESRTDTQHQISTSGSYCGWGGKGGPALKDITNDASSPKPPNHDSQSQLLRDLRPKMNLLVTQCSRNSEENGVQLFPEKLQPTSTELIGHNTQESVGNFLDMNRLRQLPKLF